MCCKHFHYNNQMYTNFQLKKYRKLLLNSRYRDAHLQFAWEKWLKYAILWLSKQKGCLFVSDDILWVWYCSEIYKNCLISTVNHSNKNVMVYGVWALIVLLICISSVASWMLKVTAIYWKKCCLHLNTWGRAVFQHNDHLKYAAKISFWRNKKCSIGPGCLPDLNTIENLWIIYWAKK